MTTRDGICFGCDQVQPVAMGAPNARCRCGGNIRALRDLSAFRTARLAHRLGGGYYVHSSMLDVANSIHHGDDINYENCRKVFRIDGTFHTFAFENYVREATANAQTKDDLDRVWIAGALLQLGYALDDNEYFGNRSSPLLQLVRHLRNGIAHGNRFRIDKPGKLAELPANNFSAAVRSPMGTNFEITPTQQGPVMFDYMGPGDFVDLFFSVEVHLFSIAIDQ